jgi:hypothetical protein
MAAAKETTLNELAEMLAHVVGAFAGIAGGVTRARP